MKVSMPEGASFGWGIAGDNLRREIALLPPIEGVTLHCIACHGFEPHNPEAWDEINIGYCFFEHDILAYHSIPTAAKKWDFIVAGSRWCEHHLRIAGVRNTTTILQGIDPATFQYHAPRPADGRFIVFSGGKFEFRKGQDLVIAAMKIFMARHPDVWLSCAWHNLWEASIGTMEQSRVITFQNQSLPCEELYLNTLRANGIDMQRVMLHPKVTNAEMASIYANSDLGIFPNRCEGGNNLVMCEYMACGRPVVASTFTGHADVITPDNAFGLSRCAPVIFRLDGLETGVWFESSVDDILERLEQAYTNRPLMLEKGRVASADMQRLSWTDAALRFHAIAAHLAKKQRPSQPASVDDRLKAAELLFVKDMFAEAELVYRSILREKPFDADLYNCLGTVLDRQDRFNEAIAYYSKALSLRPTFSIARFNLSNTLKRCGDVDGCKENLQQIVSEDPTFVDAWQNLGACMYEGKDYARATECFEQVVARAPERSGGYASLGETYFQTGADLERGIACLEKALEKQPGLVELLNLKGLMHHELEQFDKAHENYQEGLRIDPANSIIISNIGNMYLAMAMPEKAVMYFNLALEIEPESSSIRFNRAMARLLLGDYTRGWSDYEHRFNKQDPVTLPPLDLPRWDGEQLHGKILLVRSEQVYGDTIQFIRFLPLLKEYGGTVVFECLDINIKPVIENFPGMDRMVIRGESLPVADRQIPLASLPHIFNTQVDSLPFPDGYLKADPLKQQIWGNKLASHARGRLKVGIVWGGRKPRGNANRSLQLSALNKIFTVPDIAWFSLQTGDDRKQLAETNHDILDLCPEIRDFGDTAAIITKLDLIITIDTAIAHLAGALGAPTWVMLKFSPDWRWLLERHDSPWYASAQLFRQTAPGNWLSIESSLLAALENLIVTRKNS